MSGAARRRPHFSRDMLDAARRARESLGGAIADVLAFTRGRLTESGGFRGRDEEADLYYTVFGLDCLIALGDAAHTDRVRTYLDAAAAAPDLDLLHLACLARCLARFPGGVSTALRRAVEASVRARHVPGGGYDLLPDAERASIYGCFLAASALQDAGAEAPDRDEIVRLVRGLGRAGGAVANEADSAAPSTNAAVGAILLLLSCGELPAPATLEWLAGMHSPEGGFLAGPDTPVPDLVSTATAVFALHTAGYDLTPLHGGCASFVESLWDERGGFCATWADDEPDCEHTFYGLLTLGCLAGG
jgi:prenyltransferase beta subunit